MFIKETKFTYHVTASNKQRTARARSSVSIASSLDNDSRGWLGVSSSVSASWTVRFSESASHFREIRSLKLEPTEKQDPLCGTRLYSSKDGEMFFQRSPCYSIWLLPLPPDDLNKRQGPLLL